MHSPTPRTTQAPSGLVFYSRRSLGSSSEGASVAYHRATVNHHGTKSPRTPTRLCKRSKMSQARSSPRTGLRRCLRTRSIRYTSSICLSQNSCTTSEFLQLRQLKPGGVSTARRDGKASPTNLVSGRVGAARHSRLPCVARRCMRATIRWHRRV